MVLLEALLLDEPQPLARGLEVLEVAGAFGQQLVESLGAGVGEVVDLEQLLDLALQLLRHPLAVLVDLAAELLLLLPQPLHRLPDLLVRPLLLRAFPLADAVLLLLDVEIQGLGLALEARQLAAEVADVAEVAQDLVDLQDQLALPPHLPLQLLEERRVVDLSARRQLLGSAGAQLREVGQLGAQGVQFELQRRLPELLAPRAVFVEVHEIVEFSSELFDGFAATH